MSNQTKDVARITLGPQQLLGFVREAIKAREPVLIVGKPGIGKTDIVHQACEAERMGLEISHPAVEDPTDSKGIPWPGKDGETANFLLAGPLARVTTAKKPLVWFVDDLGQGTAAVQAAYMQWILARECNGHKLPKHVTMLAATNRRTDRAGVSGILEPVKSRFLSIIELQTSNADWELWAYGNNIDVRVIAFLKLRPELLDAWQPTADMTNSPSPRTWAAVSRLLGMPLSEEVRFAALAGAVGAGAALEFSAFLKMSDQLPDPDSVIRNPDKAVIPDDPSARYALVTALAAASRKAIGGLTLEKTVDGIMRYAENLHKQGHGEFAVLLVKDAFRVNQGIATMPGFRRVIASDIARHIAGDF